MSKILLYVCKYCRMQHLIWVFTVCKGLSVLILRVIMVCVSLTVRGMRGDLAAYYLWVIVLYIDKYFLSFFHKQHSWQWCAEYFSRETILQIYMHMWLWPLVFAHLRWTSAQYKWNILERAVKPKYKKKKKKKKKKKNMWLAWQTNERRCQKIYLRTCAPR